MEIRHADFERIVDPDAAFERIATGFDFTEGPVWHPGERSLIFSDILGNSIYRWTAASGLETLVPCKNVDRG